jgi:hypothetical protein
MDVTTVISAAKLVLDAYKVVEAGVKPSPGTDPRVSRWRELVKSHSLDPFTALVRLGAKDVSPMVAVEDEALAYALSGEVLCTAARTFNVRVEWLMGLDDRRYELMTLENSFTPLVHDLADWQREGAWHAIAAFKTERPELDEQPHQFGALVLLRQADDNDEHPIYGFRPVYSLASWSEPKQRLLAMRAIWAAWHMGYAIRGYEAGERNCEEIREGRVFPGSVLREWGVGTWHPDDYVVRPSACAKGDDALVAALQAEHAKELSATLPGNSSRLRRLG